MTEDIEAAKARYRIQERITYICSLQAACEALDRAAIDAPAGSRARATLRGLRVEVLQLAAGEVKDA